MSAYITIPNGRRVGVGAYVREWRALLAADPREDVKGWQWYAVKASEVLADMRRGLHERINRHLPGQAGRRHGADSQRAMQHAAREINTPRLRVYATSVPIEFRRDPRLAHRWARRDD